MEILWLGVVTLQPLQTPSSQFKDSSLEIEPISFSWRCWRKRVTQCFETSFFFAHLAPFGRYHQRCIVVTSRKKGGSKTRTPKCAREDSTRVSPPLFEFSSATYLLKHATSGTFPRFFKFLSLKVRGEIREGLVDKRRGCLLWGRKIVYICEYYCTYYTIVVRVVCGQHFSAWSVHSGHCQKLHSTSQIFNLDLFSWIPEHVKSWMYLWFPSNRFIKESVKSFVFLIPQLHLDCAQEKKRSLTQSNPTSQNSSRLLFSRFSGMALQYGIRICAINTSGTGCVLWNKNTILIN